VVQIRRCTIAELEAAPNLAEVLAEYAAECAIPEIGPAHAQVDTYRKLEAAGVFHPVGAFDADGRIAALALPIVVVLPHYGVVCATVESFFVPQAERNRGIGLRLQSFVENLARDLGAKALLFSAPVGGAFADLLTRQKRYRNSGQTFVTAL